LIFSFFGTIGYPIEVEEKDLQVLADLNCSAPAYISAIMREIVKAAVREGIATDMAEKLAKQTLLGTSDLLANESFDSLISRVATRGGITEEGVKAIQKHAPTMFEELFAATRDKHELVRYNIDAQR
jgi:pyrroline-5-carboxylate reductase